eukprot:127488-Rhodomonas_salina.4
MKVPYSSAKHFAREAQRALQPLFSRSATALQPLTTICGMCESEGTRVGVAARSSWRWDSASACVTPARSGQPRFEASERFEAKQGKGLQGGRGFKRKREGVYLERGVHAFG